MSTNAYGIFLGILSEVLNKKKYLSNYGDLQISICTAIINVEEKNRELKHENVKHFFKAVSDEIFDAAINEFKKLSETTLSKEDFSQDEVKQCINGLVEVFKAIRLN